MSRQAMHFCGARTCAGRPSDTTYLIQGTYNHVRKQENVNPMKQAIRETYRPASTNGAISTEQNEEGYSGTLPHNDATFQNLVQEVESLPLDFSMANDHCAPPFSSKEDAQFARNPGQNDSNPWNVMVDAFSPTYGASTSTWGSLDVSPTMTRDLSTAAATTGSLRLLPSHSGQASNIGTSHGQDARKAGDQGIPNPGILTNPNYQVWVDSQAMKPNWPGDRRMATGSTSHNQSAQWGHYFPVDQVRHKNTVFASVAQNPYSSSQGSFPHSAKPALHYSNGIDKHNLDPRQGFDLRHLSNRQYPDKNPLIASTTAQVSAYPIPKLDQSNLFLSDPTMCLTRDLYGEGGGASEVQRQKDADDEDDAAGSSDDAELVYFDAQGRAVCPDCGDMRPLKLKFKIHADQDRCKRHWDAHCKTLLGPPTYSLDSEIPDGTAARNELFPAAAGLEIVDDDWEGQEEDHWVARFLDAINRPYTKGTPVAKAEDHVWLKDQQTEFNRKPRQQTSVERGSYTDRAITARLRLLYMCAMNYHRGGQVPYPTGGDNWGYDEDRQMICSHRMQRIADFLSTDKRICMNVIEGRGVYAFAKNPDNYAMRKATNSRSNTKKKALITKGKAKAPETNLRRIAFPASATGSGDCRPRKRARLSEEQGSTTWPNIDACDLTKE
nr:hypothetical protein CFP56_12119 [Quercus suber]